MGEEQAELGRRLEGMVRELLAPTVREDGTTPEPVSDLHVAVISTDMGTGSFSFNGICDSTGGDNGQMRQRNEASGTAPTSTPFATLNAAQDTLPIWEQLSGMANMGIDGCFIEQPLDAALQALTTQATDGRRNHGFLREDSILAVVFVTDEDDCSIMNDEIFSEPSEDLGWNIEQRCYENREYLRSVESFVDAFRGLREDPESLVIATITGIPDDWDGSVDTLEGLLVGNEDGSQDYDASCSSAHGNAVAPPRLAEFTRAFGDNGVMRSICTDDWTPALDAIAKKIQDTFPPTCIARSLPVPVTSEQCNIIEQLSDDRPCPSVALDTTRDRVSGYHIDLGVEDGHRYCQVLPSDYDGDGAPDEGLDGWFYQLNVGDDAEACPGEIGFSEGATLELGSRLVIECETALCSTRQQCEMPVGETCDPESPSCGAGETCETDGSAFRCTPTVEAMCEGARLEWLDEPVVSAGCCHTGFHCEADVAGNPTCVPNRTTSCSL